MPYESLDMNPIHTGHDEDWAIRAEGVSKWYKLYEKKLHRLIESVNFFSKRKYHRKFYALRDVSFEIRKGETVGIIGPNGSGKSTLLGIIAGIIHPAAGKMHVNGSVASLLELGAGFNPELTGMENILFGGNMRGLSDKELSQKTDAIVRFADIGDFIHQPVKTYSSGMFVRLAFALNIHFEPDILIIDEAMAVGDYRFRAKCMNAIRMAMERGTTILLVSHDLSTLRSLCSRVMYIREGRMEDMGDPADVTMRYVNDMDKNTMVVFEKDPASEPYIESMPAQSDKEEGAWNPTGEFIVSEDFEQQAAVFRKGSGHARITFMEMTDADGNPLSHVQHGQEVIFHMHVISHCNRQAAVTISVFDHHKNILTYADFEYVRAKHIDMQENARYIVRYRMRLPFGEGAYSCDAQIWTKVPYEDDVAEMADSVVDGLVFKVYCKPDMRVWAKMHVEYDLHVTLMNHAGNGSDIQNDRQSN